MTEDLTTAADDGAVDPNAPWSYVKFDTSIGSFVIELYHRHTVSTPGVDLMDTTPPRWKEKDNGYERLAVLSSSLIFSPVLIFTRFFFFFHSVYKINN